jgi:hypothetical protein
VPADRLKAEYVDVIYSLRWQIELVFKLWKSHLCLDEWRTHQPWRVLCEVYAKLLAILIQHGACVLAGRHELDKSVVQVLSTVKKASWCLLQALSSAHAFQQALTHVVVCLRRGGRISPSAAAPPTFQKMRSLT